MQRTLTVVVLAVGVVLIGCGDSDDGDSGKEATPSNTTASPAEIPVVDITKTDEAFEAPDSIPGGLTRFRFHNQSTGDHGIDLLRLEDGATLEQLHDAIVLSATDFVASKDEWVRLTASVGGTAILPPDGRSEVVLDLEPGRYVIVSFILGTPFTRELEVTAAPAAPPAPPEAAFTVRMADFAYAGAPDMLPAGKTTIEVVNDGPQLHMMAVWRVNEQGVTTEQVSQHLTGTPVATPPTYARDGGIGEMDPGRSGWVTLDLDPGTYVLACIVFDNGVGSGGTGKLHSQLGMNHPFTAR